MKKLVRKLSTRKPDRNTLTDATSTSTAGTGSSPLRQSDPQSHYHSSPSSRLSTEVKPPSASGTQAGFIPFGMTLHFPACPHTTPPTPRPASIPSMLLTQVSSATSPSASRVSSPHETREYIIAAGSGTTASRAAAAANQFFTTPRRCFDCTLSLARDAQRMTHDAFDTKIRAGRSRIGLACADLASLEMQLRLLRGGGGASGDDGQAIDTDISALRGEILQAKEIVREWVGRRDEQVKTMWETVMSEWEGGVREVVRDDGSGEGLQRCVFNVRVVPVADVDVDARQGERDDESGDMEGGLRVEVVWENIE